MELTERETLIRVEQQLVDSIKNQGQIMSDLKDIFQRIERDSKLITSLDGSIRGHTDTSKLRWDSLDQRLSGLDKKIESLEQRIEDTRTDLSKIKESQTKFEEGINSSIRTVKAFMTILTTISSILGGIAIFLTLVDKLK